MRANVIVWVFCFALAASLLWILLSVKHGSSNMAAPLVVVDAVVFLCDSADTSLLISFVRSARPYRVTSVLKVDSMIFSIINRVSSLGILLTNTNVFV